MSKAKLHAPPQPFTFQIFDTIDGDFCKEDVLVRLIHFWEARNFKKRNMLMGVELLLIDSKVINKTYLRAAVGADLSVMERDALRMRDGGPFVFAQIEMISEAIDETFDKDEAEEETEDLTNQVLDEIGVALHLRSGLSTLMAK